MILIKERACMLNWKNGFQRLHQKRILFYRAKGSHARSHHAHAQSHTSLRVLFCSCSFRLSRSTALQVMASTMDRAPTSRLHTSRREALFEIATDICVVHA